jgi:hypothetical protein
MPARLFLHLAVAAVSLAPFLVLMVVFAAPPQGELGELLLYGCAVLAGQLAALFAWRSIRQAGTTAALFNGIVMGVVIHVLFGPVLMVVSLAVGQKLAGASALYLMFLASWHSLKLAWITLPLCATAAVLAYRLHQRQLPASRPFAHTPRRW